MLTAQGLEPCSEADWEPGQPPEQWPWRADGRAHSHVSCHGPSKAWSRTASFPPQCGSDPGDPGGAAMEAEPRPPWPQPPSGWGGGGAHTERGRGSRGHLASAPGAATLSQEGQGCVACPTLHTWTYPAAAAGTASRGSREDSLLPPRVSAAWQGATGLPLCRSRERPRTASLRRLLHARQGGSPARGPPQALPQTLLVGSPPLAGMSRSWQRALRASCRGSWGPTRQDSLHGLRTGRPQAAAGQFGGGGRGGFLRSCCCHFQGVLLPVASPPLHLASLALTLPPPHCGLRLYGFTPSSP